jgi:hypothetical protein
MRIKSILYTFCYGAPRRACPFHAAEIEQGSSRRMYFSRRVYVVINISAVIYGSDIESRELDHIRRS